MKKILFGIALLLFSVFLVVLDQGNELPGIVELLYIEVHLIGLGFCVVGLLEKKE